ncbi:MAG: discoidin domain-containing protein, partial [Clostridia bacterium]|nr:discoidin domain-containing protein [Clostridia bacterium]
DGLPDGHFIIDMGEEKNVSGIGYRPRTDFGFRVSGGMFYGSEDREAWTLLYTIPQTGNNDMLNYAPISKGSYRYIKYTSDGAQACNMAEVRLYSNDIMKVNINGVVLDYKAEPMEENGTLLLPLRAIAEQLGANVGWVNSEQSAAVIINDKLIKLPVGKKEYYIDGEVKTLAAETRLIDGVTFIDASVIIDAMNAEMTREDNKVFIRN